MGGYTSRETEAAGGGAAAAVSAQQQGAGGDANEEKYYFAIFSALRQAKFNVIDGTAAPPSGQVHHPDSPRELFETDLESNHRSVHVGCVPRSFDFIVKHSKCVWVVIVSTVGNCWKVVMAHCTPAEQVEELQERCYKYSQKALGFEILTFIASCFAVPVVSSSSTGSITILIVAAAGLLVAISIELFSLTKKKTKLGRGSVYLSSSLVISSTFLMFISFDKLYAYGILSVPVLIVVALFQHKLLPGVHDNEEAIQEELDNIFDNWTTILSLGAFVTLIFTHNMQAEYSSASVTGFFFMFTIVLGFFEMMVAAARLVTLTHLATYLWYLLIVLFIGTLTCNLIVSVQ